MKLCKINISKEKVFKIKSEERYLIFQLMNIHDELNILYKTAVICERTQESEKNIIKNSAQKAQFHVFLRLIAGKTREGFKFIYKTENLLNSLTDDDKKIYEDLNNYFDPKNSNPVNILRDKLSFHYGNYDEMKGLIEFNEDFEGTKDSFNIYAPPPEFSDRTNIFFEMGFDFIEEFMISIFKKNDLGIYDILKKTNLFICLLDKMIISNLKEYFSDEFNAFELIDIPVEDEFQKILLPYFSEQPDQKKEGI